jgi:hypothetical protein
VKLNLPFFALVQQIFLVVLKGFRSDGWVMLLSKLATLKPLQKGNIYPSTHRLRDLCAKGRFKSHVNSLYILITNSYNNWNLTIPFALVQQIFLVVLKGFHSNGWVMLLSKLATLKPLWKGNKIFCGLQINCLWNGICWLAGYILCKIISDAIYVAMLMHTNYS